MFKTGIYCLLIVLDSRPTRHGWALTQIWQHLYYYLCHTTCRGRKWVGTSCLKSQTLNELALSMQGSVPFDKRPIRPLVDSHSLSESYKHILLASVCRMGLGNIHYWTIIFLPKRVLHTFIAVPQF